VNTENIKLNKIIVSLSDEVASYKLKMIELQQRSDIQDSLNEMLNISLMQIPLNEQMNQILLLVLNIPWLSLDKKGCIFLTDEFGTGLKMVAHHNLGESLLSMCKHIKYGQCLCGKAASSQKLIFRDCVDDDHDIRPLGMQPHGHYNMPIISNDKTLGVLNLYVKHGHIPSSIEQSFLMATSKAMASIIERKKIEEKLYDLSYIDELTGIANRRHFMNHLGSMIIESNKNNHSLALLFIDLDFFKSINDTYGHEYGDQILIDASQRMQECIRATDFVARLGGDEFVVILEMISTEVKAQKIAENLISAISKPYTIKNKTLSIGASIGVSIYPTHDMAAKGLLKKADEALYQAKENRGAVILYKKIN